MDRDPYQDMFRFALGQCVRYAEDPAKRHYIAQRRWTQRPILSPVVTYKLGFSRTEGGWIWVGDADLEAWPEATTP